jgi:hypothetical protein
MRKKADIFETPMSGVLESGTTWLMRLLCLIRFMWSAK